MANRLFLQFVDEQRSEAWRLARLGKLTASRAGDMLATRKDGKPSSERTNLKMQLVLERLTGKSMERDYQTPAMRDGIEREPLAIGAYEALTGDLVRTCGFLAHLELMAGASPDGYLGDFDTLVSIKCRQPAAHFEFLRTGRIPSDAMAQMRHELWLTGATSHHYFSFNPDFPPKLQSKLVIVTFPESEIAGYEVMLRAFLREVDEAVAEVQSLEASA